MAQSRILMILTSNARMGLSDGEAGLNLDSFATPFYAFEDAGFAAEVATISGGEPPIEPASRGEDAKTDAVRRMDDDSRLRDGLKSAPALRQVQSSVYDAVFLPDGVGAVWDFPASPELTVALEQFALQSKPIVAIGYGAAALVPIMDRRSQPLTRERRVACVSDDEVRARELDRVVPFLVESKLRQLGAIIEPAAPFEPKIETDGFLITGQNAASSQSAADALIEALRGARIAA